MPHAFRRARQATFPSLVILFLSSACSRAPVPPASIPMVAVEVARPQPAGMVSDQYDGVVMARRTWNLGFTRAGKIVLLKVAVGQKVHAGQIIAVLDQTSAHASADQAAASLRAARAASDEAADSASRARDLDKDHVLASGDVRARQLDAKAASSKAAATAAELRGARAFVADGVLTAPEDGIVTDIAAEAGTAVSAGAAVVMLASGSQEVAIRLPEAAELSATSKARVRFGSSPTIVTAALRVVAPVGGDASRMRKAWFTLPPETPWQPLNSSVSVAINSSNVVHAMRVPLSALDGTDGRTVIWTLRPDQKHVRPFVVRVLDLLGEDVVITGLPADQMIVTNNVKELRSDSQVTLVQIQDLG